MTNWLDNLRRRLAVWLTRFEPDPPEGYIIPDRQFTIDDGVDYSLPLVVPDWLDEKQRGQLVQAAVKEANSLYHFQFDRPYLYGENLSQFPTADPLREWDFATRKEILSRCHLAFERNPLAHTAVRLTTMFAIGEGLTINYYNDRAGEILDEFRDNPENAIQKYEKSFCDDLQIDGELFVRFHSSEDGRTVITVIPPWEIQWIVTEPGFSKRVISYHRQGVQTSGEPGNAQALTEDIPAEELLHVCINDHAYETRGRPELFRILPWLKAFKDWLEGRARQNHWRGSILYDVTLKDATPAQVTTKRNQYRQPPSPGSIAIHNDREAWDILDSKVGAADVAEDGRQIKLMSAVGLALPEYMLSDGQNANLASATAQQLPALRKFVDFQDIMVSQVWQPIYDRVLQNAIDAGVLEPEVDEQDADGDPIYEEPAEVEPEMMTAPGLNGNGAGPLPPVKVLVKTPKRIAALDAYDLAAPELESSDPQNLAGAMQVAVANEWASNETAAGRMGFDYRLEHKKIEREKSEAAQAAYQGRGTPPVPPEMEPMPMNGNTPAPAWGPDGPAPAKEG